MLFRRLALTFVTALLVSTAAAAEFKLAVTDLGNGIFALIGPTTDRTYENHGLNANFGVIDTPEGAILIDSGASLLGAKLLEAQAQALTGKPVRWVINTGAQDHRWFGNAYFIGQGAEVVAHRRTAETQQAEQSNQWARLSPALKDRLDGTEPTLANRIESDDTVNLTLGGRTLVMHYFGDAHFPGDVVLWLPDERIAFAGDHVYVDRILGIRPFSNAESWLAAFDSLIALEPAAIVPGHGQVTDIAGAQADTGDYLGFIVEGVARLADEMAGAEAALSELGEAPQFRHLENFDELHRQNVQQAYLRAEAGL